jgi:hypothetical protein
MIFYLWNFVYLYFINIKQCKNSKFSYIYFLIFVENLCKCSNKHLIIKLILKKCRNFLKSSQNKNCIKNKALYVSYNFTVLNINNMCY